MPSSHSPWKNNSSRKINKLHNTRLFNTANSSESFSMLLTIPDQIYHRPFITRHASCPTNRTAAWRPQKGSFDFWRELSVMESSFKTTETFSVIDFAYAYFAKDFNFDPLLDVRHHVNHEWPDIMKLEVPYPHEVLNNRVWCQCITWTRQASSMVNQFTDWYADIRGADPDIHLGRKWRLHRARQRPSHTSPSQAYRRSFRLRSRSFPIKYYHSYPVPDRLDARPPPYQASRSNRLPVQVLRRSWRPETPNDAANRNYDKCEEKDEEVIGTVNIRNYRADTDGHPGQLLEGDYWVTAHQKSVEFMFQIAKAIALNDLFNRTSLRIHL